jgi:hypothetical protein
MGVWGKGLDKLWINAAGRTGARREQPVEVFRRVQEEDGNASYGHRSGECHVVVAGSGNSAKYALAMATGSE